MIKIGIIGTGGMANAHARCFNEIRGCKVVAACDVKPERVEAFVQTYGIPRTYLRVEDLLKDPDVDAVSNVTPDSLHKEIALKAIRAGKHILSEKPLATNYPDARAMARAAKRKGVINMVNFSYRSCPAIQKMAALVAAGRIGRVVHVEASYYQSWLNNNLWGNWRTSDNWLWRLSTRHGSMGALGDIGVHMLDFATFPAGHLKSIRCELRTFPKAEGDRVGEYVLDANDSAVMLLEFKNGALGTVVATRWATGHVNRLALNLYGDRGAIRLDLDRSAEALEVCSGKDVISATWKTVRCPRTPNSYQRFVRSIRTGVNDQPDFARGAEIQKAIDACVVSDREERTIPL